MPIQIELKMTPAKIGAAYRSRLPGTPSVPTRIHKTDRRWNPRVAGDAGAPGWTSRRFGPRSLTVVGHFAFSFVKSWWTATAVVVLTHLTHTLRMLRTCDDAARLWETLPSGFIWRAPWSNSDCISYIGEPWVKKVNTIWMCFSSPSVEANQANPPLPSLIGTLQVFVSWLGYCIMR